MGNEFTVAEMNALTASEPWIIIPDEYIDSVTIGDKVVEKAAKRRIFVRIQLGGPFGALVARS